MMTARVPEGNGLYPAFKEWQAIVEALGAGEQILILRKGGLAEDEGGFRPRAGRYWLFPTTFHGQRARLKPAALARAAATPAAAGAVTLRFFAETAHQVFLTDWEMVRRLEPFHLWTETTIRERYDWGQPRGVHALLVRVHRLHSPLTSALTAAMRGCRSWIVLPHDPAAQPSDPVLADPAFAARRDEILALL